MNDLHGKAEGRVRVYFIDLKVLVAKEIEERK
jgi:hypothetical protein